MQNNQNEPELLTVKEAADMAKVHLKTVYVWIYRGKLDVYYSETGFIRIPKSNLMQFLNSNKIVEKTMAE